MRIPLPVMLPPEPPGDAVHRTAVKLSLVALLLGGVLPLLPALVPRSGAWVRLAPDAHARAMTFGFIGLFVVAFLFRIVPRGRAEKLRRPRLAEAACVAICLAAVLDGVGAIRWGLGGRAALSVCWGFGLVGLLATLGVCWRGVTRPNPWVEGWVGAGLVSMTMVGVVLTVAPVAGFDAVLRRAPAAFLFAGLVPVTVGFGARMIPALCGIGPVDRDAVAAVGRWMMGPAVALTVGLLADAAILVGPAATLLVAGILRAAAAMRWLRIRTDGDALEERARSRPEAVALRWTARASWALLALAQVALLAWAVSRVMPEGTATPAWGGMAWVLAIHLVGLGFLSGMTLGIGQRVLPAFVRDDVRLPRLRYGTGLLWFGAVAARVAATVDPSTARVSLPLSMALLLAGVGLFAVQVRRSLRSPGATGSPCPSASTAPMPLRKRIAG